MKPSNEQVNKRLEEFKKTAKFLGFKLTHQRLEIFRIVAASEEHPGADDVYRKLRASLPTISLDTVYRTLWMLSDLGLLNRITRCKGKYRFDANLSHHHHFSCSRCGLIRDFSNEELNNLPIPEEADQFGESISIHVEVSGVCEKCLKKESRKEKKSINKE
jgi:Fur family peroxide stress response transcriptional regulator